jgi:hypothetical protein
LLRYKKGDKGDGRLCEKCKKDEVILPDIPKLGETKESKIEKFFYVISSPGLIIFISFPNALTHRFGATIKVSGRASRSTVTRLQWSL